jgi:hypothetical protein
MKPAGSQLSRCLCPVAVCATWALFRLVKLIIVLYMNIQTSRTHVRLWFSCLIIAHLCASFFG